MNILLLLTCCFSIIYKIAKSVLVDQTTTKMSKSAMQLVRVYFKIFSSQRS